MSKETGEQSSPVYTNKLEYSSPAQMPISSNSPVLSSWVPICLQKTDQTISRLSKIISTPSGTDTLLLTISYTSLLTSSILTSISLARIRNTARVLMKKVLTLPPETTFVLTTSTIPSSRLLVLSMRLKALSSLVSDVRIFARLRGLLGIWIWGKSTLVENTIKDKFLKRIEILQVLANLVYQFVENYAYLSGKGVLGWSQEKQKKAWAWSSRFWALHVMLEFMRLWRERKLWHEDEERKRDICDENKWINDWKKQIIINTAYTPLTLHWSSEKGLVSEFWVGLFGSLVGVIKTHQAWNNSS